MGDKDPGCASGFSKKRVRVALLEFDWQYGIQQRMKIIRLDVSEKNYPAIRL
ncbi:MAG: hypothetical protein LUG98_11545 [Tannerellaceae bacterium]|nr:hypothetical protein [Tannerellaceae bacterium]